MQLKSPEPKESGHRRQCKAQKITCRDAVNSREEDMFNKPVLKKLIVAFELNKKVAKVLQGKKQKGWEQKKRQPSLHTSVPNAGQL